MDVALPVPGAPEWVLPCDAPAAPACPETWLRPAPCPWLHHIRGCLPRSCMIRGQGLDALQRTLDAGSWVSSSHAQLPQPTSCFPGTAHSKTLLVLVPERQGQEQGAGHVSHPIPKWAADPQGVPRQVWGGHLQAGPGGIGCPEPSLLFAARLSSRPASAAQSFPEGPCQESGPGVRLCDRAGVCWLQELPVSWPGPRPVSAISSGSLEHW